MDFGSFFSAGAAAVLVWAAVSDVRRYLIPNSASLLLVALFALHALSAPPEFSWQGRLVAGGATLAVAAGLFYLGFMGGGDAKLLGAVALWAGPEGLAGLLAVMGISGGVLALVVLTATRLSGAGALTPSGAPAQSAGRIRLPYGVAIAAGGLWALAAGAA